MIQQMTPPIRTGLRLTVREYDDMIARGAFAGLRGRHIELINGELREMAPQGPWHSDTVAFLQEWSYQVLDKREARIRVQLPIWLPVYDTEPEPDLVWARPKSYRRAHPLADEVLLLVEVAVATVGDDLGEGAEIYSRAGIQDYWVVDLPARKVHVHRQPTANGYQSIEPFAREKSLAPLAFPQVTLELKTLLDEVD